MTIYNDLLIVQLIVPKLCKETLRYLITELKKMERSLEKDNGKSVSTVGILELLSSTQDEDPVLQDFLLSSCQCQCQA